jgi:hypothetical protein
MARPTFPCASSIRAASATMPQGLAGVKAKEDYCLRHEIPFPHFNRLAGPADQAVAALRALKAKGAVFEEVYGHERPRWFARTVRAARLLLLQPAAGAWRHGRQGMKAVRETRRHHGHLRLHQGRGVRVRTRSVSRPARRQQAAAKNPAASPDPHAQPARPD